VKLQGIDFIILIMTEDEKNMKFVLELALLGLGFTSPNPCVGAVIVKNSRIVGIGYHKKRGDKHAEIIAIEDARGYLEDATLYVNLEPCTIFGATPPCAPVIKDAGIKRVVISNRDPNPKVNGRGIAYLKENGIDVIEGVLENEGAFLNRFFFYYMKHQRPYLIGKIAVSLDGFIADKSGNSRWISGDESRRYVHKVRGEVDGIMVGKGTVEKDDPSLLPVSFYSPKIPARILVAMTPFTNFAYKIFTNPGRIFIVTSEEANWCVPKELSSKVTLVRVKVSNGSLNMHEALEQLGSYGIQSILCEGGSYLMGELLRHQLLNEIMIFYSPIILGDGIKVFGGISLDINSAIKQFKVHERIEFEQDTMLRLIRYD